MLSPSPTQQPPAPPAPEQKPEKKATQLKRRRGETPAAQFIKAILRPPIKLLYFFIRAIRNHKWASLIVILLCLTSIASTSYIATGKLPLGIGDDPFNFHVRGNNGGGDKVKNWLYALRDGNTTALQLLDKDMSNPPDPAQLVGQYSQKKAGVSWKAINVLGAYSQADTTVDSFVEIDISTTGPGGDTKGMLIWHFVTLSNGGQEFLLKAELIDARAPLT